MNTQEMLLFAGCVLVIGLVLICLFSKKGCLLCGQKDCSCPKCAVALKGRLSPKAQAKLSKLHPSVRAKVLRAHVRAHARLRRSKGSSYNPADYDDYRTPLDLDNLPVPSDGGAIGGQGSYGDECYDKNGNVIDCANSAGYDPSDYNDYRTPLDIDTLSGGSDGADSGSGQLCPAGCACGDLINGGSSGGRGSYGDDCYDSNGNIIDCANSAGYDPAADADYRQHTCFDKSGQPVDCASDLAVLSTPLDESLVEPYSSIKNRARVDDSKFYSGHQGLLHANTIDKADLSKEDHLSIDDAYSGNSLKVNGAIPDNSRVSIDGSEVSGVKYALIRKPRNPRLIDGLIGNLQRAKHSDKELAIGVY